MNIVESSLSDTSVRLALCSVRFLQKTEPMRHKTVQECLDPWPEGLVTSVVKFGILLLQEYLISTALWYDLGNLKLEYFFFFSGFVFLLFRFH